MERMRLLLAGVPNRLAAALRSDDGLELERTDSAADAMHRLQRSPAPGLLVVSEALPGAGDVLACVEADCRLSSLVVVVVVGDRTALAVALRRSGVAVVGSRGAGPRLRNLARTSQPPSRQARERLLCLSRERADSARCHVSRSQQLVDRSRKLCALSGGGARLAPRELQSLQGE